MNYLGHLYLSDKDPSFMTGVFIADYIKGKKYEIYPKKIQKGILFHRYTDSFTDQNSELKALKKMLYPSVGKYAGVVLDIYLDHVLAKNWEAFSNIHLRAFSKNVYLMLIKNQHYMPWISKYIFIRMFIGDWLQSYKDFNGFEAAIKGMSFRPRVKQSLMPSIDVLKKNEHIFEKVCLSFLFKISKEKM